MLRNAFLSDLTPSRIAHKRLICLGLSLLLLLAVAAPALGESAPPAPLCYTGTTDYTYADDHLWINIQKRTVTEPHLITYFVCDIQTSNPTALKSALGGDEPKGLREPTADIASRHDAKLAINGDGYGFHKSAVILRNGELIRAKRFTVHQLLTLSSAGDLSVITGMDGKKPEEIAEQLQAEGVQQIWAFGPELVRDGAATDFKDFKLIAVYDDTREPRSAIGQIAPLHYVIVLADGRRDNYSTGMTLLELQKIFLDLGVKMAFNLDGGGSTTLYFNGEVINKPSGGGERSVSDIVLFN